LIWFTFCLISIEHQGCTEDLVTIANVQCTQRSFLALETMATS